MELREVLRRHNVPNNYRRGANEYVQQYEEEEVVEEEEDDFQPATAAPSPNDGEWNEDDDDEEVYEPKSTRSARFVPKTNDKVAAVYSQIFGRY